MGIAQQDLPQPGESLITLPESDRNRAPVAESQVDPLGVSLASG
jgi:hypothetical protein